MPVLSLFSVVAAFAELIFKLVSSLATTFINVILRFGRALSLFSVVSVFADMIFGLGFSFLSTFINVILCFEQDLGGDSIAIAPCMSNKS